MQVFRHAAAVGDDRFVASSKISADFAGLGYDMTF